MANHFNTVFIHFNRTIYKVLLILVLDLVERRLDIVNYFYFLFICLF